VHFERLCKAQRLGLQVVPGRAMIKRDFRFQLFMSDFSAFSFPHPSIPSIIAFFQFSLLLASDL
jgi:hypothetical protein